MCPRCGAGLPPGTIACDACARTIAGRTFSDDLVGTRVNGYRIVDRLGAGGVASVWRARAEAGRDVPAEVAVKVMHGEYLAYPEALERFDAEARALERTSSRHFCATLGKGTLDDSRPYFVLELAPGEPLDAWLRREGRLPMECVWALGDELLSALVALHEKSILHRDLKPSNVIVSAREGRIDRVVLLDLGVAKFLADDVEDAPRSEPGAIVGTLASVSPEQCRGEMIDGRADLYGLAVLLFEVVTGARPFESDEPRVLIDMHRTTPPVRVSSRRVGVPSSLERWIARCLAKDPSARYATSVRARIAWRRARRRAFDAGTPFV